MSTAHTKGRLIVKGRYSVCTEDGETEVANTRWTTLDSSNDEDNARRLVACWNRLLKFKTEQIEDFGYDLFADIRPDFEKAMRERDELKSRCDEWEKKAATWLASPEAVQRLDGYRDLAQQLNTATTQRDELLKALKVARDHIDMGALEISHCKDAEQIRAAIAKAEGGEA